MRYGPVAYAPSRRGGAPSLRIAQARDTGTVTHTHEAHTRDALQRSPSYYRAQGDAWNEGLRHALNNLPAFEWEDPPHPLQGVATGHSGQMQG